MNRTHWLIPAALALPLLFPTPARAQAGAVSWQVTANSYC